MWVLLSMSRSLKRREWLASRDLEEARVSLPSPQLVGDGQWENCQDQAHEHFTPTLYNTCSDNLRNSFGLFSQGGGSTPAARPISTACTISTGSTPIASTVSNGTTGKALDIH